MYQSIILYAFNIYNLKSREGKESPKRPNYEASLKRLKIDTKAQDEAKHPSNIFNARKEVIWTRPLQKPDSGR